MEEPDVFGLLTGVFLVAVGALILVTSRPSSKFGQSRGNATPGMWFLGLGQLLMGISWLADSGEGVVFPASWHRWTASAWVTLGLAALVALGVSMYHLTRPRRNDPD